MRKFKAFICIILVLSLSLSSCGRAAKRITDKEAMPIQDAIDAILHENSQKYKTVFPPDYNEIISDPEWSLEGMNIDDYLKAFVKNSMDTHVDNHGKNINIEFVVKKISDLNEELMTTFIDDYIDYNVIGYTIPVDKISKFVLVEGSLNVWGKDSSSEKYASYILFCQDNTWYLHPVYYFVNFS
ncbi:hypothetical protein LJB90_03975 [Eubacteriales bacterium OttesenSCG-928-G02]|nr:hypothetical protein [Eubacteriales bacterium OttesenSCG-928-G02]